MVTRRKEGLEITMETSALLKTSGQLLLLANCCCCGGGGSAAVRNTNLKLVHSEPVTAGRAVTRTPPVHVLDTFVYAAAASISMVEQQVSARQRNSCIIGTFLPGGGGQLNEERSAKATQSGEEKPRRRPRRSGWLACDFARG